MDYELIEGNLIVFGSWGDADGVVVVEACYGVFVNCGVLEPKRVRGDQIRDRQRRVLLPRC